MQHDTTLTVWGRPIAIPESSPSNGGVARFTFKQLCAQALSASDYLEITKNFQHIFVTDIPQLTLDSRDQARRFIVFIDTCYENKVRSGCSGIRYSEVAADVRYAAADKTLLPVRSPNTPGLCW